MLGEGEALLDRYDYIYFAQMTVVNEGKAGWARYIYKCRVALMQALNQPNKALFKQKIAEQHKCKALTLSDI